MKKRNKTTDLMEAEKLITKYDHARYLCHFLSFLPQFKGQIGTYCMKTIHILNNMLKYLSTPNSEKYIRHNMNLPSTDFIINTQDEKMILDFLSNVILLKMLLLKNHFLFITI